MAKHGVFVIIRVRRTLVFDKTISKERTKNIPRTFRRDRSSLNNNDANNNTRPERHRSRPILSYPLPVRTLDGRL